MPHFMASDLGQLSLPISDKKDARLFKRSANVCSRHQFFNLFAYGYISIYLILLTQVDLTSNFFVLCTKMNVY